MSTLAEQVAYGLAVALVLGLGISQVQSFDTFWQLQSGKYLLETGSFIHQDIFSLAADAYRHEHCWLHDLILYLVYVAGGYAGLSILKGLLVAGTFALLMATARGRGASLQSVLLIAPPAFFSTAWLWRARPQLWTFLFCALFLWILERHRRQGDKVIFWLFPLMLLWANLHAGSILAFPLVAAYLVGATADQVLKRSSLPLGAFKSLWVAPAMIFVAAFATPYGFKLIQTLIASPKFGPSVGVTGRFNIDWQVTTFAGFPTFYLAVVLAALLLFLGRRKICGSDLLLLAGLAFMGHKLARHTPFFFFGITAILPLYVDAAVRPLVFRFSQKVLLPLTILSVVATLTVFSWFMRDAYLRQGAWQAGLKAWYYPLAATSFLKQNQLPGNLFNSYEWGGYLMWELYPDYRVFWDGRQDSAKMYGLGLKVQDGEPEWQQILDDYQVNTILVKPLSVDIGARFRILDRMRESPRWALVYSDDHSLIFVRITAMDPGWLAQHQLPKERIDQVIISEGMLLLNEYGTNRYRVYWEAFRIFFARREYGKALQNLEKFKMMAPEEESKTDIVQQYEQFLQQLPGATGNGSTH